MNGLNLTEMKYVYVRNKNRFGDVQGILFEVQKGWEWVQEESLKKIRSHGFNNLIKNVCDLRGISINGLPVDMQDINIAIQEMGEKKQNDVENSTYDVDKNGFLVHKKTGELYISSYGCSCIIEENHDAKRPKRRGYRTGITASKAVIRTMTPMGYWKTAKLDVGSEVYTDDHALYECAHDFLAMGLHHKVKGNIPTDVFVASKKMTFVFEVKE
jgi:hypothetical protein